MLAAALPRDKAPSGAFQDAYVASWRLWRTGAIAVARGASLLALLQQRGRYRKRAGNCGGRPQRQAGRGSMRAAAAAQDVRKLTCTMHLEGGRFPICKQSSLPLIYLRDTAR